MKVYLSKPNLFTVRQVRENIFLSFAVLISGNIFAKFHNDRMNGIEYKLTNFINHSTSWAIGQNLLLDMSGLLNYKLLTLISK